MPPKLQIWGWFDPIDGKMYQQKPQKAHPCMKDVIWRIDRQNRSTCVTCARVKNEFPRNCPFPLGHVDYYLINTYLNWPHSPLQTTAWSVHALPCNYATKSPLVTVRRPKFTLKTAPAPILWQSPPHLIHSSFDRSNSQSQMASGSNQPFCHSALSPTDRNTDWHTQTIRWNRRQVSKNSTYTCYIDRVQCTNNLSSSVQCNLKLQH